MSFKQNVCEKLIISAGIYKTVFMDYDYLIYSDSFVNKPYYIIHSHEDNFAHLTGVKILIPPKDFYTACLSATIEESHFDFMDKYKGEKSIKNTVKRKYKAFTSLPNFFLHKLQAEEDFSKGTVYCTVGTADDEITLGFIESPTVRPKSLLKGNALDATKSVNVSLILKRVRGSDRFDTIVQGDVTEFCGLFPDIFVCNWYECKKESC